MATQLQLRSGTTLQNDIFTGAPGELTYDTEKKNIRIHDGVTEGGMVVASQSTSDFVIAWQNPTADNNYTWYRKYASGWVEQGGYVPDASNTFVTVSLPIEMDNPYYSASVSGLYTSDGNFSAKCFTCTERTVSSFRFFATDVTSGGTGSTWQVSGLAAQGV